jgi:hypothetical protein
MVVVQVVFYSTEKGITMSTHSTVPQQPRTRITGPDLKQALLYTLKKGKSNAMTCARIDKVLDLNSEGTYTEIRKACTELLEVDRVPVISCNRGMFIAETEEELKKYRESIAARAEGLFKRLGALKGIVLEPNEFLFPMEV